MDNNKNIVPTGCCHGGSGRALSFFIVFGFSTVFSALPGCSPNVTSQIRTEVQYRDRLVPIATTFNIPYFVERNFTKDTTSHLENPFAKSDAVVSAGLLYHTLETIPQEVEKEVLVHVTDTLYKEAEIRTEIKEVEKPLSKWKSFKLEAFWWLLGCLILCFAWIFRKPITAILKRRF